MPERFIFASLTRIADLHEKEFQVVRLPKDNWANGDFVATRITNPGSGAFIELQNGRMMVPLPGERVIGALGVRHATLEATGTWEKAEPNGEMSLLTGAGLVGKMTSRSIFSPVPIRVEYLGHIHRQGRKLGMADFVTPLDPQPLTTPAVLLVGTSMSAGKTTTGRIVTHQLKEMKRRVLGVKLTGAGRYRDVLSLHDAGAESILDFVDAGLPSSICEKDCFGRALDHMLARMAREPADVAVVEIGASPFEPYNGAMAIERVKENVCFRILCASDPYAVVGVMKGFDLVPDLVTGPATNTIAGEELVEKLCGIPAMNLIDPSTQPRLRELLKKALSAKAGTPGKPGA